MLNVDGVLKMSCWVKLLTARDKRRVNVDELVIE